MVLLGAAIALVAALLAQVVANALSRGRERDAATRRLAADLLGRGRLIQSQIHNARALRLEQPEVVAQLGPGVAPFTQTAYELVWVAPHELKPLVFEYQDAVADLIDNWDAQREGFLDQPMADAGNALANEVRRLSAQRRPGEFWRRPK